MDASQCPCTRGAPNISPAPSYTLYTFIGIVIATCLWCTQYWARFYARINRTIAVFEQELRHKTERDERCVVGVVRGLVVVISVVVTFSALSVVVLVVVLVEMMEIMVVGPNNPRDSGHSLSPVSFAHDLTRTATFPLRPPLPPLKLVALSS